MTRLSGAAVLILSLLGAPTLAGEGPFIQITVSACESTGVPAVPGTMRARFVFDTSAPPVSTLPPGFTFAAVDADLSFSPGVTCDDPFSAPASVAGFAQLEHASLFYSSLSQALSLTIETQDETRSVNIIIASASPGFTPMMTSLPGAPEDYAPAYGGSIAINAQSPETDVLASWISGEGFTRGRLSVDARLVQLPEPPGCTIADLAEPYGVHDFDDVLAFLSAFGAGCPRSGSEPTGSGPR